MFFVNKKTVFPILLMMLGMSMVWGGGNVESILVENSEGFDINSPGTYNKKDRPTWIKESQNKNNGEKSYIGIAIPNYDDDHDGYSLDEAKEKARLQAEAELSRELGTAVFSYIEAHAAEYNGDYYSKTSVENRAKSSAFIQGLSKTEEFWEKYRVGKKIKDEKTSVDYYQYWRKFVISKEMFDAARKSVLEREDFIKGERSYFKELKGEFETTCEVLDSFVYHSEDDFPQYKVKYDPIKRIKDIVLGLQTYKNTESPMQKEDDKAEYKLLLIALDNAITDYDPSDMQQLYENKIKRINAEKDKLKEQYEKQILQLKQENTDLERQITKDLRRIEEQGRMIVALFSDFKQQQDKEMAQVDYVTDNLLKEWGSLLSPSSLRNADRYTVKRGDYLAKIAREYYGNSFYWPVIYAANSSTLNIRDPNKISIGSTLRIPKIPDSVEGRALTASINQ
jgi:LysM repeat protein